MRVALVGGGVIGGGWAGRLVENGVDVVVYDPAPGGGAPRTRDARERRASVGQADARAPRPRRRSRSPPRSQDAVARRRRRAGERTGGRGAQAPTARGDRRARAPGRTRRAPRRRGSCRPGCRPTWPTPSASSSGIRSTRCTCCRSSRSSRASRRSGDASTRAVAFYGSLGMKPLRVRTEIDGFVADRLLEALWREALWLVHDDVATVEEIDDAIRYGPGCAGRRWARS